MNASGPRLAALFDRRLLLAGYFSFLAGGLYGWSGLTAAIIDKFAVTTGQTSMIFSLAVAAFTFAIVLAPLVPAARQDRLMPGMAGLAAAMALGLAAMAADFALFVFSFSLVFGSASGILYISSLTRAAQSGQPRLFVPLIVGLFGLGGALLGPLFKLGAGPISGLDILWLPAAALALGSLFWFAVPDGAGPALPEIAPVNLVAMVNRSGWRLLWFIFCSGSMAGLVAIALASSMVERAGGAVWLSVSAISGIAAGNSLGRVSIGLIALMLHPRLCVQLALLLIVAGLLAALAGPLHPVWVAAGLCLVGIGYGMLAAAVPVLTRILTGSADFQSVYALIFTGWGMAGLCAPWLAGMAYDWLGNFQPVLFGGLAVTLFALIACQNLAIKQEPNLPGRSGPAG